MDSKLDQGVKLYGRIPKHIGVIPDGNRRWAQAHHMEKKDGYRYGIKPGFELYELCREIGVEELTLYGFTVDNTKRPAEQKEAFQQACVEAVEQLAERNAELLVVGNTQSDCFPKELLPYTERKSFGVGGIKVNFLVNYGWDWDLMGIAACERQQDKKQKKNNMALCGRGLLQESIRSKNISRMDLLLRWGGRNRLSGFLPVQSVYADTFIFEELWPDFSKDQFYEALKWYQKQDVTLGG